MTAAGLRFRPAGWRRRRTRGGSSVWGGTAVVRTADLSRPVEDAEIDLDDGGAGVMFGWADMNRL